MGDGKKPDDKKTDLGNRFNYSNIMIGLAIFLIIVSAFNQYQISALYAVAASKATINQNVAQSGGNNAANVAGNNGQTVQFEDVRPKGTPAIYGPELDIKYDDVSESNPSLADDTIRKLAVYDQQINFEGAELQRYVKIGSAIACEYCCGATTLVFSNGQPACGCAHSYAMRGLAKYLISKHGSEYTDEQILEELGKWKVLFFPSVHAQKAAVLKSKGIELNYINLASNKYRGIEKNTGGTGGTSQVGGC